MLLIHYVVGVSQFAECRKMAGDCMRNSNKYPKIPHSATARGVEKWPGIRIRDRSPTKSCWSVLPISKPDYNSKFHWNGWLLLQ